MKLRIVVVASLFLWLLAYPVFGFSITEEVRERPLSVSSYVGLEVDFFAEVLAKILKSAKPVFVFTRGIEGLMAIEANFEEFRNWNLIFGKYLDEEGWFVGAELKGLPIGSEFRNVFRYFRPGIGYDFETKSIRFMIAYEFRPQDDEE